MGRRCWRNFPHDYANDNLNPVRLAEDLKTARTRATARLRWTSTASATTAAGRRGPCSMRDSTGRAVESAQGDAEDRVWHGADLLLIGGEADCAAEPEWNYQSIAKGYTAPGSGWDDQHSTWKSELYFEYHRRDDHAGQPQAQHAREFEEVLNSEKWSSLAWLDAAPIRQPS